MVTLQVWDDSVKEAVKRIQADKFFSSAFSIANRVSQGDIYLAGGKLYRTIAEVLYGVDYGSNKADWDFVSIDTAVKDPIVPFWKTTRGPSISPISPKFNRSGSSASVGQNLQLNRSWRFEYAGANALNTCSIDVIAMEDIQTGGIITDYLDSVPLSVQAIALQLKSRFSPQMNGSVIGNRGESALRNQVIHWNNQARLKPIPAQSPDAYFSYKLASLPGFLDGRGPSIPQSNGIQYIPFPSSTPVSIIPPSKITKPQPYNGGYKKYEWKAEQGPRVSQPCSCSSNDLFKKGCKCGAVIPYDANAVMNRKYS